MNMDIRQHEARVNITFAGQNGDLPDTVRYDCTDGDVRGWVTEALRGGTVVGINGQQFVDLGDHVVDRFPANLHRSYNLIQVRPKTPFG